MSKSDGFNPAVIAWLVLCFATAISWVIGGSDSQYEHVLSYAAVWLIVIAFIKVRLILLYFMGLAHAPKAWRWVFDGWCVSACGLLVNFLV